MEKTARVMMTVLNDKWLNYAMSAMTPLILLLIVARDSALGTISLYVSCVLFPAAVLRIVYVACVSARKDVSQLGELVTMNRKRMIRFYVVNLAVYIVLFVFTVAMRIPVAMPLTALLVVITGVMFALTLRRYKREGIE